MDLGLVGLVDKIEEIFGRTLVRILLFLLCLLVGFWLVKEVVHAWVAISDLINRGGRIGTAVTFGVMLLNLLVWWITISTMSRRAVERAKEELVEWDAKGRPPEEGSEKSSEVPSLFSRIRDIAIVVAFMIGITLLMYLWLSLHEWALAIIEEEYQHP